MGRPGEGGERDFEGGSCEGGGCGDSGGQHRGYSGQGGQSGQGGGGRQQGGGGRSEGRREREEEKGESHEEQTQRSWDEAFWAAYKELQVEAIKAKLKEAWGERMAKTAGEIVAAHSDEYEAFQRQEAAREAYEKAKEELAKAYEAMKSGKAPVPDPIRTPGEGNA